jgi:peptidyl-prolyl cis-trans isomerase B (cyclophilin B)
VPLFFSVLLTTAIVPVQPMSAPHMWTPVGGSLPIDVLVDSPGASLVLMRHDGTTLATHKPMPLQQLDVLSVMPAILELDEPAYLQLVTEGGEPLGSSLVIEPALSRRIPIMETRHDDTRGEWRTVVGWQDEGVEEREDLPESAGRIDSAATPIAIPRDDAVVRSGWWIWSETDVVLETDHGKLTIDLREDAAPLTARNFRDLVACHFYDGTIVHRIIPEGRGGRPFVVQGGDPTGTGSGGPGHWLPLEPSTLGHAFGVISMARSSDPDSAGSQWFIALDREECARLDGLYCAFGEVVQGGDTIVTMATTPLADTDYFSSRPMHPPRIERGHIKPAPPRTPGKGRPDKRVSPPTEGLWQEAE